MSLCRLYCLWCSHSLPSLAVPLRACCPCVFVIFSCLQDGLANCQLGGATFPRKTRVCCYDSHCPATECHNMPQNASLPQNATTCRRMPQHPARACHRACHRACQSLLPHNARACRRAPQNARACRRMPEPAPECQSLPHNARACRRMPEPATTCHRMPQNAITCHRMPQNAHRRMPQNSLPHNARACRIMPEPAAECQSLPQNATTCQKHYYTHENIPNKSNHPPQKMHPPCSPCRQTPRKKSQSRSSMALRCSSLSICNTSDSVTFP
uniref:Uncharacterized protein n=1 Tax=Sparus aurata TaxID=8175 RepID=A0A671UKE8_SPAAU